MPRTSPTLHSTLIGTAGWAYPHWNRTVYPRPHPPGFHPVGYLSRYLEAVEINTSFYSPLRPELPRLWVQQVKENDRFRFTAKVPRAFTHERSYDNSLIELTHEGFRPLVDAGRLGCLLLQFPWSFRFTPENREYFIKLRRLFHAYPLVAEMRHSSWMSDEALGTFMDYHVGFANIDQPQYVKSMPPTAFLTSSIGYVRLHGRSRPKDGVSPLVGMRVTGEQGAGYDYLYSAVELAEWKQRIDRLRSFSPEVYVIANNDGGGKSVVNALQLRALVENRDPAAPPELLRHYGPELRGYTEPPRQESLFETGGKPRRDVAA
ncbi:MAG: DUF72 domain-containing protein [Acidobacteria bacterium]|nr:DUF72 domain-containing protein [Acidobacteriota bacterium]